MHASHRGHFETDAELYFASIVMHTARNIAKKSSINNCAEPERCLLDKQTETLRTCDDKNTRHTPIFSIAILHQFRGLILEKKKEQKARTRKVRP